MVEVLVVVVVLIVVVNRHGSGGFVDRSPALHASPARLLGTTSNLDPRATGQGRRNGGHRGRQEGVEVEENDTKASSSVYTHTL